MVVPSTVIMVYSKDLLNPSPVWAYFATAIGIFAYQILDELDGKQVHTHACIPYPSQRRQHPRGYARELARSADNTNHFKGKI
jgi:hypothetical protein